MGVGGLPPCFDDSAFVRPQVKQATDTRTSDVVAVKFIEKPPLEGQERMWKVLRSEIACLERVKLLGGHPAIVRLHDVRESHDRVYVIMEFVAGQDMLGYILEHAKKNRAAAGTGAVAKTCTSGRVGARMDVSEACVLRVQAFPRRLRAACSKTSCRRSCSCTARAWCTVT